VRLFEPSFGCLPFGVPIHRGHLQGQARTKAWITITVTSGMIKLSTGCHRR